MNFDGNLIFSEDQAIGAASVSSAVIDLGSPNAYHSLWCIANLTTKMTSGKIDSIAVVTATDAAMTTPITMLTLTLGAAPVQTAGAAVLAQFRLPTGMKQFMKLVFASTSPVGGKVFAGLVKDAPVR